MIHPETSRAKRVRNRRAEEKPLFETTGGASSRNKANVLLVAIYKREGSKYFQALIRFDEYQKRISTHTTHQGSARQFAELAYKHFNRLAARGELEPLKRKGARTHE